MLQVSSNFKTAISASKRKTDAIVEFGIIDVDANTDATVSATALYPSKLQQTVDNDTKISHRLATFENDFFKLDGSMVIPPRPEENISTLNIGIIGNILCNSSGVFSTAQDIIFQFTKDHSSIGLTIIFDTANNEYAKDFTVTTYNSAGTVITTDTITNNTKSTYALEHNMPNYRKIKISITKWCRGYRRVRLVELIFGIGLRFTSNELTKLSVLEETDITNVTLPSNEMQFTIDNISKQFNILNPQGIYQFLQQKQKATGQIGVELPDGTIEYVPCGTYYLKEWSQDTSGTTASFTLRDIIDTLGDSQYLKGIYGTTNLYALAEKVILDAGITNYSIDSSLSAISVNSYVAIMGHREILQYIAMLGGCAIIIKRDGTLSIKPLDTTNKGTIDLDNMYSPPEIKQLDTIKNIEVVANSYVVKPASEVLNATFTVNGTRQIFLAYNAPVNVNPTFTVTGGTYTLVNGYANGAVLNITANGTVTVIANGTSLEIIKTTYNLNDTSVQEGKKISIDNPLISTELQAQSVATFLLNAYRKKLNYNIPWRQDMSYTVGDTVTAEDEFGENRAMVITKQEFDYDGALDGKTEGRG